LNSKAAGHKLNKANKNPILKLSQNQSKTTTTTTTTTASTIITTTIDNTQKKNDYFKDDSRIIVERLLDNSITYKDVPVMRDLLLIQKKIRFVLPNLNQIHNFILFEEV
jgi:hypothetical protein